MGSPSFCDLKAFVLRNNLFLNVQTLHIHILLQLCNNDKVIPIGKMKRKSKNGPNAYHGHKRGVVHKR